MHGQVNPGVKNATVNATLSRKVAFISKLGFPPSDTVSNSTMIRRYHRASLFKTSVNANGWRPPAPYRVFAALVEGSSFDYELETTTAYYRHSAGEADWNSGLGPANYFAWGTQVAGGNYIPDVSQNMINQTVTEALVKLQDQSSNILETLGELKETYSFLVDSVRRLARFIILMNRRRYTDAFKNLLTGSERREGKLFMTRTSLDQKSTYTIHRIDRIRAKTLDPSDVWLQYQYGVMPLIWDITGAMTSLSDGLRKKDKPLRAMRRIESNYGLPFRPFPYSSTLVWEVAGKCTVGAETCIYGRISSTYLDALNRWGLSNIPAAAWDLAPYSFVVDWLIPIGNVLRALSTRTGIDFVGGFTNTKVVTNFSVTVCWKTVTNIKPPKGSFPTVRFRNVGQLRSTHASLPLPGFYIKSPFSTNATISAFALISTATLRR